MENFLDVNKIVYDYCKSKYGLDASQIATVDAKRSYKRFVIFTVNTTDEKIYEFKLIINNDDFVRSLI